MNWQDMRERALRLADLFRRRRIDREMDDELQFHLAMSRQKYSNDSDARARRDLGSIEKWKDACRDVRRFRPVEDFLRDLALAVRMLRKTPGFTAVALITLALAIGANTAVFSLMNALLLRPLPVPRADRLVMLRIQPDDYGYSFPYPLFTYVEQHGRVFSQVFGFTARGFQLRGANGTERIDGELVSGQYFTSMRLAPERGRYFGPQDDHPGGGLNGPVAVISDRFWRVRMGARGDIVGRKITLDNVVFTIAGVAPPSFPAAEVGERTDIYVPLALEPLVDAPYNNIAGGFHSWWVRVGARLRDGVTPEQANAFLRATSRQAVVASADDPKMEMNHHKVTELYLVTEPGAAGFSYLRLRFRKPLNALMVLVTVVLLIACLNLATLLMARSAAREREMATRFALGASRGRLLRQLLTESMLLAVTGAMLGLAASPALSRLLLTFVGSQDNPLYFDTTPDIRVFIFTAAVTLLATALTGMAPALRSTGRSLQQRMRESSGGLRGVDRRHLGPRLLLASEVALALVLVTGAGLLGYSLVRLNEVPLGFEPRGLVLLSLEMEKQSRDGDALMRVYHEVADRLAVLPGVKAVSYADQLPISGSWWTENVGLPGQPQHELYGHRVGPDYFRAMRTPLLAGRPFRWSDTDATGRVAILNASASRLLFPHQDPVGRNISFDMKTTTRVIGIVGDAKYTALRDAAPPTVYSPMTQDVKNRPSFVAMMRVDGPPTAAITAARAIVRRIAPEIPVPVPMTMEGMIAESIGSERMMATLALFFAGIALLITGVGLYGTLAYATERRTGEIGIRMALGARRGDVMSMVCRENAAIALGGCLAGLGVSLLASRLIAGFLYSTSPRNPAVLGAAALLLASIAAAASLIPALRASRIDPIRAIRYE